MENLKQRRVHSDAQNYRTPSPMSTRTRWSLPGLLALTILVFWNSAFSVRLADTSARANGDTLTFCFISDTQEPLWFERVFVKYNDNARARGLILDTILALNPKGVIHLGDEVGTGSENDTWREIDEFVGRLRQQNVEFLPIPGNHEYLYSSKQGIANFKRRYPDARVTGYSRQFGSIVIVLVNSNFTELTKVEKTEQLAWYQKTLRGFETDTSVDFVIVGCHRPPFTNSKVVSGSKEIRDSYLPEFYKSRKCKLFVSGHSHAFEHFTYHGKDFLVLGGGGGLQHQLKTGKDAEYKDVFSDSLQKRMFHFVYLRSVPDTLTVGLMMLRNDFGGFDYFPQLNFVRGKNDSLRQGEYRLIPMN